MRIVLFVLALQVFLGVSNADAQYGRDPFSSPSYDAPRNPSPDEAQYDHPGEAGQLIRQVQEFLVWEGLYPGPLDGELGGRTIAAIKIFQRTLRSPQDGKITKPQFDLLRESAIKKSQAVSFNTISDPQSGVSIGLPMSLVPLKVATPLGTNFTSRDSGAIVVGLRAFRTRATLAANFERLREGFAGAKIDYSSLRENWFVLSGESGAYKFYARFHLSMDRLAGFFVVYKTDSPDFAVPLSMMSMSLQPFSRGSRTPTLYAEDHFNEASLIMRGLGNSTDSGAAISNNAAVYWRHKDSILRLTSDANSRVFTFEKPSKDDLKQGITSGSEIFKGSRSGSTYRGIATAYQAGCSPIAYAVSGVIASSEEEIELKGRLPARDATCRIVGFSDSTIQITFIKPASTVEGAQVNAQTVDGSAPIMQAIGGSTQDTGATSSKILLDSLEELLAKSNPTGIRFFKYVVDKANLAGFREDMPVLRIVFPEQVFFDTDKSSLRADAISLVSNLAGTIKSRATSGSVAIFVAGHTDGRGSDAYNLGLSYRRADSVARSLSNQDLGGATLWRVGFGKAVPVRLNDGPKNWALNRRVEFLLASQPSIIKQWIQTTKSLCEDANVDCGGLATSSIFKVESVGRPEVQSISVEVPGRPSVVPENAVVLERPALPFNVPERPSLFIQSVSE